MKDEFDTDEAAIQYEALRQRGDVNMWDRYEIARVAEENGMEDLATIASTTDQDRYLSFLSYYQQSPIAFADRDEPTWTVVSDR